MIDRATDEIKEHGVEGIAVLVDIIGRAKE